MALTEEQKKANKAKNDHEYYLRNKDKIRDYKRIWARKHYQENRQKCIAYQKQYWQNTTADRKRKRKNKMAEYICEFRQENPDAARKYYRNAKHKWTNGVNCTKKEIWQNQ